jgi:light-regulated signal transduction histidine kinase (bacteriophytochrome)
VARVWLVDRSGQWLDLEASAGPPLPLDESGPRIAVGEGEIGRIAVEGRSHLGHGGLETGKEGMVAAFPLLIGDRVLGVLGGFATVALPADTFLAFERTVDNIANGIDRRHAEVELDERARDLARSNADLEQFAYVASHDLQEPLRIVASYNQLLARRYRGKLDQDADEFIAFSVDGITRMQRLISDLLAYSRVGSHGREFAPVDVERAFGVALHDLSHAIADAGARVTHDPLPTVKGEESQIVQLLQNLIGNAIKFRGSSAPTVHVGARRAEREWIFSVADNGIGIEPQYFDRIFVIFQRLNSRESYPGTGIGLALCQKIVERHGGKIWVDSIPERGATFFFTLPVE